MHYIVISLLTMLIAFGTGGYFYYKDTQSTIQELTEKNVTLKSANESCQLTLKKKEAEYEEQKKNREELEVELRESEEYKDRLIDKLRRHDLTKLTMKKPGMIEKRVNDATEQIFEDLESISRD